MKKCVLGDLMEVTRGASLAGKYYATSGEKVRLTLANFDYSNNCFKADTSKDNIYYTQEVEDRFLLQEGDIITPLTEQTPGLLGTTARIPESGKYIQSQDVALLRPFEDKLDPDFCFYLVSSKSVREQLGAMSQQTKIRHSSPDKIKGCTVFLPDIVEQKKIGRFLSTIDRKIALNRKRIATLEAMAKEIYDYWFVQFDFPDSHGRPYKSSGGAMVYNPDLKREIPKGWEVKPLGELTRIILGGTPATEESRYWEGGTVPWLSSGEVANFPVLTSEKKITELAIRNSATDLMPSGSVALSITRYIRPTILAIEACANQSVVGVLETDQLHNSLIYPYLVSQVPRFLGLRTGAQQPHINKDTVSGSMFPVAATPVLKLYYDLVDPVYNDIMVVARNLQEMYKLREFLLPLLMNGQVKVG